MIKRRIEIASGRLNAELVLKNCKIINVFTDEIISGDIAIDDGYIVAIGDYSSDNEIDIKGKYVAPGLIDAHVHIESSMVTLSQFAKAIIPAGTTTIIADPHEIANVCGIDGIKYLMEETNHIPLDVKFMIPSCVPATPFESSKGTILADDMKELINHKQVLGLGEFMDFFGVISGRDDIVNKLNLAKDKIIDGHGPGIESHELNAYAAGGIHTDHECSTLDEMINRMRLGMYIQIREGSAAKNLKELVKGVTKENLRRITFCTDDRHPNDILKHGHIDNNIRTAMENGVDIISAIKMATLNTAECYRLYDKGAVAPGYTADLIVFDSLEKFEVKSVFIGGEVVAQNNTALFESSTISSDIVKNTINFKPLKNSDLDIPLSGHEVNVIKLLSHSLVTKRVSRNVKVENNLFIHDSNVDILKIAVIERHNHTGNIGLGLIENFGLRSGAIASTVAHDSHNIIVVGTNDEDMLIAIDEIKRMDGGLTLVDKGNVIESIELPIAGLMSTKSLEEIDVELESILKTAYKMGINKNVEPFMTLAFLALPVIPDVKITDKGIFDISLSRFIGIEEIL